MEPASIALRKSVVGYRIHDAKLCDLMRDKGIRAVYVRTDKNNIYRIDSRGRVEAAKGKKGNATISPKGTLREGGDLVYGVASGFFMRRVESVYYAGKITEMAAAYRSFYPEEKVTVVPIGESEIVKDFEAIKGMRRDRVSGQAGGLKGEAARS